MRRATNSLNFYSASVISLYEELALSLVGIVSDLHPGFDINGVRFSWYGLMSFLFRILGIVCTSGDGKENIGHLLS